MTAAPRMTVVVPSRDRPELLAGCLKSLRPEAADLQVIVVDDGSRESLAEIAGAAGAEYVRQPPLGLNAARNRGVEAARAPLVAFLDDDVLVEPGWAAEMLAAAGAGAEGVAGRITLALAAPAPRWLTPALRGYLSEYDLGETARWLTAADPAPVGANCAVRRDLCLALGGFRTGLDRNGDLLSNGDTEFFGRLERDGARLRYAAGARVRHRIGADRLTVGHFRRRAFAQGLSDARMTDPRHSRPSLRRALRPARVGAVLVHGLVRGHGPIPALLLADYWRGRLSSR